MPEPGECGEGSVLRPSKECGIRPHIRVRGPRETGTSRTRQVAPEGDVVSGVLASITPYLGRTPPFTVAHPHRFPTGTGPRDSRSEDPRRESARGRPGGSVCPSRPGSEDVFPGTGWQNSGVGGAKRTQIEVAERLEGCSGRPGDRPRTHSQGSGRSWSHDGRAGKPLPQRGGRDKRRVEFVPPRSEHVVIPRVRGVGRSTVGRPRVGVSHLLPNGSRDRVDRDPTHHRCSRTPVDQ